MPYVPRLDNWTRKYIGGLECSGWFGALEFGFAPCGQNCKTDQSILKPPWSWKYQAWYMLLPHIILVTTTVLPVATTVVQEHLFHWQIPSLGAHVWWPWLPGGPPTVYYFTVVRRSATGTSAGHRGFLVDQTGCGRRWEEVGGGGRRWEVLWRERDDYGVNKLLCTRCPILSGVCGAYICWPCWYSLPSLSTVSVSVVSSAVPSVVLGLGWLRKVLPRPPSRSLLWLRL